MTPEAIILAGLRNEPVAWPAAANGHRLAADILDAAAEHGVSPLLAVAPGTHLWPDRIRAELASNYRAAAAIDALRQEYLVRLVEALASAGIDSLVLKGAQLAFTHYPKPWLRPRLDTDLFVDLDQRSAADRVLRRLGYQPATHFDGHLVTHQFQYRREDAHGVGDSVDLHWRIANPHVFAGAFTFRELAGDSRPIPSLGGAARGLSDAHALLLACMHRVAHHANSARLIWLYDIHLLTQTMTSSGRESAAAMARERGLGTVCAAGIELAAGRFATDVPRRWIDGLRPADGSREPGNAYLKNGRTKIHDLAADLRTLRRWRDRFRLLVEHVLPPAAYIRHAYGVESTVLVALAYVHRICGAPAWFRPTGRPR